jgi:endonuclease-3
MARESEILDRLGMRYGRDLHTQLAHKSMEELFVAVFLSPQCTDKQVNNVTKKLFRRFRSFNDYADVDIRVLRRYLKGLNYYKTKARNLKASCNMLVMDFGGTVPRSIGELTRMPGIGRKVANVILEEGYGICEGIAVDTHCGRVARRLGLSRHMDPYKVEKDLMRRFEKDRWCEVSNHFIELGRDVCTARIKKCGGCVLNELCPSSNTIKD